MTKRNALEEDTKSWESAWRSHETKRNAGAGVTKLTIECGNFLCHRQITLGTYRGRKPKYCSESCKMQAYRERKHQAWLEANRRPAGTQWDCPWCHTRTVTGEEHTGGVRCGVCGANMATQARLIH
jgi:hypothetical protein